MNSAISNTATEPTADTATESRWSPIFDGVLLLLLAVRLVAVVDLSRNIRAINRMMPASVPNGPAALMEPPDNQNPTPVP